MSDLSIVLDAARKWADELTEYIAPDAEQRGADQEVDDYQAQADKISAAITALEGGRDSDPSPVSHNPCLQGKVLIDGAESDFLIPLDNDSVGFSQWGAPNEVLWGRVELLDGLGTEAREWWADNKPEDDDGEATDADLIGPIFGLDNE